MYDIASRKTAVTLISETLTNKGANSEKIKVY